VSELCQQSLNLKREEYIANNEGKIIMPITKQEKNDIEKTLTDGYGVLVYRPLLKGKREYYLIHNQSNYQSFRFKTGDKMYPWDDTAEYISMQLKNSRIYFHHATNSKIRTQGLPIDCDDKKKTYSINRINHNPQTLSCGHHEIEVATSETLFLAISRQHMQLVITNNNPATFSVRQVKTTTNGTYLLRQKGQLISIEKADTVLQNDDVIFLGLGLAINKCIRQDPLATYTDLPITSNAITEPPQKRCRTTLPPSPTIDDLYNAETDDEEETSNPPEYEVNSTPETTVAITIQGPSTNYFLSKKVLNSGHTEITMTIPRTVTYTVRGHPGKEQGQANGPLFFSGTSDSKPEKNSNVSVPLLAQPPTLG